MKPALSLIVIVTYFVINWEQSVAWTKGTQVSGWVLPSWVQTTEIPWRSNVECYVRCALNSSCTGLYYNETNRQCLHFQVDYIELWNGFSGDCVVFFAPMKVIMVTDGPTYSLDFTTAGTKCSSLRGRLITFDEMVNLWIGGFEMCSCGWIESGINMIPEQSGCGGTPQLVDCELALAHAYCVLN